MFFVALSWICTWSSPSAWLNQVMTDHGYLLGRGPGLRRRCRIFELCLSLWFCQSCHTLLIPSRQPSFSGQIARRSLKHMATFFILTGAIWKCRPHKFGDGEIKDHDGSTCKSEKAQDSRVVSPPFSFQSTNISYSPRGKPSAYFLRYVFLCLTVSWRDVSHKFLHVSSRTPEYGGRTSELNVS